MIYVGIEVIRGFLAFFFLLLLLSLSHSFTAMAHFTVTDRNEAVNANFSLDFPVGILVKFVEFKPVGFKACLRRFGKQQFICFPKVHDAF